MKLQKFLKRLSLTAAAIILFDNIIMIPSSMLAPYFWSPTKKENAKITEFKRDKDLGALEYMVLAHSITNRTLVDEECDCKDYGIETFRNYKKLIKEDGREDLADDVRLAFGSVYANYSALHVWNEIKLDGKWKEFETTNWEGSIHDNWGLKYQAKSRKEKLTPESMYHYIPLTIRQADQNVARINFEWFYKSDGFFIPMMQTNKQWIEQYLQEKKNSEKK
ncbi:MAG: hypothetical protein V1914_04905 [archaeon]